jgi:hypothetical protein
MKLSAWHKLQGDTTEWYVEFTGEYDKVYVSKVFSFTPNYEYPINAKEIVYGGSGYAISLVNGKEIYQKQIDKNLPEEIEHIYPDYNLYGISDTAYGFMSRGCPRGCDFCHVKNMQGMKAQKVADLSEFWNNQKNIVLLDPNISACTDWKDIFQQLINSKAYVDFSQGLDIRLMTDEKIEMLKKIKCKGVHFAWDRYEDKKVILPKLKQFKESIKWDRRKIIVYVLCGADERRITQQDLERIYKLREIGCWPYVMLYDKESLKKRHELKKLQRWVNNRIIWESTPTFEEYLSRYTKI